MRLLARVFAVFFCSIWVNNAIATQLRINVRARAEIIIHKNPQMRLLCFTKTILFDGQIIIFDLYSADKETEFRTQIVDNFKIIAQNPIGEQLLGNVVGGTPIKTPLVIFSCDFVKKIRNTFCKLPKWIIKQIPVEHQPEQLSGENEESYIYGCAGDEKANAIVANDEILMNLVPDEIKQYMPRKQNSNVVEYATAFKKAARIGNHFVPKESGEVEFPNDVVFISTCNYTAKGFEYQQHNVGNVNIINIPLNLDITLFHELNHYRHKLLKYKTIDEDLNPLPNSAENNSSLGIHLLNCKCTGFMKDSEEELQLTGYTRVQDEEVQDLVNETNYRLHRNGQLIIRFPYLHEIDPASPSLAVTLSVKDVNKLLWYAM